ncbi:MAG: hypothetical protein AB8H03_17365 [Saprospiraceae bacterium]
MITTQKSVGADGQNLTKDVAQIQLALFSLGHLSQSDFKNELPVFFTDAKLSSTILAIKDFQKKVVKSRRPDGRVDVGGKTLRTFPNSLKIQGSVGARGKNNAKDIEKIQQALFELGYLSESDLKKESAAFNNNLVSSSISFEEKIKDLPKGRRVVSDLKLIDTILAIQDFQKKVVKSRRPDGRVDAGGKTFKKMVGSIKKISSEVVAPVVPDSFETGSTGTRIDTGIDTGNEVEQIGKSIVIKISAGGKQESKSISIEASRHFISNYYNWSGVVKLMDFVYKKNRDTYNSPSNLTGTVEDNVLIIPDDGVRYVIQQQLADMKKRMPLRATNLKTILKAIDGKPGKGFLGSIIKKSKIVFTNEINNKSLKDADGNKISIPSLKDGEAILYNFFKKIVIARNGLWSDNQGVTNLVGLRRNLDRMMATRYNDSLVACWKDESGNLRVEINIATTEPGNKNRHRTVAPQTLSTLFGFHHGRQPAGRTRNLLVRSARKGNYKWEVDKGFNFHQGGNTFIFPKNHWLTTYGIDDSIKGGNTNSKFNLQQTFELNLTLTEIYYWLSQFGTNGKLAPYQNLKNLAESKPMKIEKVENGIATISQIGLRSKRRINIFEAKKWMVGRWYDKRFKESSREIIAKILSDASGMNEKQMTDMENLKRSEVIAKIKDEWVVKVIEHQFKFYPKLSDIDGKAGPDYYRTLIGIKPSKEDAKKVYPKVKDLIKKLEKLPLQKISALQKVLRTGLRIHTNLHRENVRNNTRYDEMKKVDLIANVLVNGYSAGCQVIYDTETFYDFWLKLLQRANKTGQRKWYYTLIDATTWKKTDVV